MRWIKPEAKIVGALVTDAMDASGYKPHEIYRPAGISYEYLRLIRLGRRLPRRHILDRIIAATHLEEDKERYDKFIEVVFALYFIPQSHVSQVFKLDK